MERSTQKSCRHRMVGVFRIVDVAAARLLCTEEKSSIHKQLVC